MVDFGDDEDIKGNLYVFSHFLGCRNVTWL